MSTVNTSTGPPTVDNPRGRSLQEATGCTLGLVVVVVALRLWGRFGFTNGPRQAFSMRYGDHRFWVLLSDISIIVSTVMAMVLTALACYSCYWGMGLHIKLLSVHQRSGALEGFYIFQIFYKFAAGISKVSTCLLLLAISSQQMVRFNLACQILIVYIIGYSFSCSIATVFQCGIDFYSNWIPTNNQKHCFYKPPFWYTHAGLNILASVLISFLPWWLFYHITYKRKYLIATLMTMLAIAEIIFGCVRLKGLYISAQNLSDLTFGASTGLLVSQLEVNFGVMAACIPTVLKLSEVYLNTLIRWITGRELTNKTTTQSQSLKSGVPLSHLDKSQQRKNYTKFGEDEENDLGSTHSGGSRVNIISKGLDQIKVESSFLVEETTSDELEGQAWPPGEKTKSSTNVRASVRK